MADAVSVLISEAKKCRYSFISDIADEDVLKIWYGLSALIQTQMLQTKGLTINGFGTFTFSQRKVDIGGNKILLIQRPVLLLSENLIQTHSLTYPRQHASGHIPVMLLNYTWLSNSVGFGRETVETCLREVLRAFARRLNSGVNINLDFSGVGKLVIKGKKARMKFFKDFIESMDESGTMKSAFRTGSRPDSTGSIISASFDLKTPVSEMLCLPKIVEVNEDDENQLNLSYSEQPTCEQLERPVSKETKPQTANAAVGGRPETPFHTPKAVSALSFVKPLSATNMSTALPSSRPSTCSHSSNSQELCYVCHQRAVNNVPISVAGEKRAKEKIQEKLLQDFINQRDTMELARERYKLLENKKVEKEVAQFNMEKDETRRLKDKDTFSRGTFYPSYLFQNRSMTPCFTKKQIEYCKQLDEQVRRRRNIVSQLKKEEEEKQITEQQQLKKELQVLENEYTKVTTDKKLEYLQALNDQINMKNSMAPPPSPMCQPVFGIQGDSSERLKTERERAKQLRNEQIADATTKRKTYERLVHKTRQEEAEQLRKNREDLLADLKAARDERREGRKDLETSWLQAAQEKIRNDPSAEDCRKYILLQEQCNKYLRCKQCQRKKDNKGASNILSESRYIGGSRLIV